MAGRIESAEKKSAFIDACRNINPVKVVPDKLLQAKNLLESLNKDEIDTAMLYKCGCPCNWVESADKMCVIQEGIKLNPRYCNLCAKCWLYNLTEEVEYKPKEKNYKEIFQEYDEYVKTGLSPKQIKEILYVIGWYDIYDFELLMDTLEDMKNKYNESGE